MEKQALLGGAFPSPQVAQRQRGAFRPVVFITILALWALASYNFISQYGNSTPGSVDSTIRLYPGESLKWRLCGDITGHRLECATVEVPMDQFNSTNSGDLVFQIPLVRMRGRNATKNLLLNPGGPGVGGTSFVYALGDKLNTILGEDFHLVGFDPRGVNASIPQARCYANALSRHELSPRRSVDMIRDSPYLYAWASNFVRGCEDTSRPHFQYVNTPQTAADMNSILDALGQNEMYYWGISYGSLLGQVYATLFPERSERVVIDAVMDQFQTFEETMDSKHFIDNDAVLDGFFDECVMAGSACPLSIYGKTGPELRANVTDVVNSLRSRPASVFINGSTYGVVDDYDVWINTIFHELYTPANWPKLASHLAELQSGNATSIFLNYVGNKPNTDIPDSNIAVLMNDGKSGPKYWQQSRMSLMAKLLPYFDQYHFAIGDMPNYYIKQQWSIPRTHSYNPERRVETVHPVLMLSTTHDPGCPYANALEAQRVFTRSRLVSIDAYGHSSFAKPSLCAAHHLRAYLVNGTLPKDNVRCEAEGPYFPERKNEPIATISATPLNRDIIEAQRAISGLFGTFI